MGVILRWINDCPSVETFSTRNHFTPSSTSKSKITFNHSKPWIIYNCNAFTDNPRLLDLSKTCLYRATLIDAFMQIETFTQIETSTSLQICCLNFYNNIWFDVAYTNCAWKFVPKLKTAQIIYKFYFWTDI